MKAMLAVASGFVLTLAVFASGAAVAVWFLAAEPVRQPGPDHDEAGLWTLEPRAVDASTQDYLRVPARPVVVEQAVAANAVVGRTNSMAAQTAADDSGADAESAIDATTTASIDGQEVIYEGEGQRMPSAQVAAHVEWCADRYRSYRPRDNSYTPYRGGRRPCVSPYLDEIAGARVSPPPAPEDSFVVEAGAPRYLDAAIGGQGEILLVNADHVEYCFSRYRSYRPEDNSYQPYGGGPRRQCE